MILQETDTLANGVRIPKLALGTWQMKSEDAERSAAAALRMGYRHIDTAAAYGNERSVGNAVRASGLAREDIFLTTKIPAEEKTRAGAEAYIAQSLALLQTDYIDLMLIHAPRPWDEMGKADGYRYFDENLAVWQAMEAAHRAGKLRAIGVSNFGIADIENLLDRAEIRPVVNQIAVFIGHVPEDVIGFCRENGMLVMAYSPIATGGLLGHPVIADMAAKYGVSPAQICIRFDLQLGLVPLPKTTHEAFMAQNADVDFVIAEEDMRVLRDVQW